MRVCAYFLVCQMSFFVVVHVCNTKIHDLGSCFRVFHDLYVVIFCLRASVHWFYVISVGCGMGVLYFWVVSLWLNPIRTVKCLPLLFQVIYRQNRDCTS